MSHVSSVSLYLMVMAEKEKGGPSRFRLPKSAAEEEVLANEAVQSSTKQSKAKGDESADFRSRL